MKKSDNLENMEKGVRSIATGAAVAAGLIGAPNMGSDASQAPTEHRLTIPKDEYSSKRMLNTISEVESGKGQNVHHKELSGIHSGESAYGKYGLTPVIIRETIKMNPELSRKYKKAGNLKGQDLHNYMKDNPGLEDAVAGAHLKRLEHHFGQNPSKIGYAWLQGIKGTYKQKDTAALEDHWHVKKIKDAYSKEK